MRPSQSHVITLTLTIAVNVWDAILQLLIRSYFDSTESLQLTVLTWLLSFHSLLRLYILEMLLVLGDCWLYYSICQCEIKSLQLINGL